MKKSSNVPTSEGVGVSKKIESAMKAQHDSSNPTSTVRKK